MRKLLIPLLVLLALPLFAEEDAENCKDSPLLTRMPKCWIGECSKKDFDEADVRIAAGDAEQQTRSIEGEVERHTYACEEGVSLLAVVRNAEGALKKSGFTTVFSGKGDNETPAVTMRKGGVWVSIATEPNGNGETIYHQTIVRTKEMEQEMVANAASYEAEIQKTGQCSIYGILFDTGKASIVPSSETCLNEVVTLLKGQPTWRMQVEGHTDNVGGKEANLALSQQRAEAVRAWLVAHGVEASRLTAKGFGEAKPLADNTTEEGRAKNRRVALTKL